MGEPCTTKSDTYSFGITMYEIFSRKDPYYQSNEEVPNLLLNIVRRKLRPEPPAHMPTGFVNLFKVSAGPFGPPSPGVMAVTWAAKLCRRVSTRRQSAAQPLTVGPSEPGEGGGAWG
jgi:serine/threonine protein kinase